MAETLVSPIVTYGSESWTTRKKNRKKNLMHLNYEHNVKTNMEILQEVRPNISLETIT